MRKVLFSVLILGIIVFMSCEEPEVNPFIGTWENEEYNQKLIFTDNEIININPDDSIYWKGNYTYNDTHLIITIIEHSPIYTWGSPFTPWYTY